jgi:ribokinase
MKKIVVLGSINMDLVTMVERKPLDGETITGKDFMQVGGGKGANQAISISKLGGEVVFLGKVGEDTYGQELKKEMSKNKIDVSKVEETTGPTGLATIIVDAKGENSIIVVPGSNGKVDREYIDRHKAVIEEASTLLCQLELPLDTVK